MSELRYLSEADVEAATPPWLEAIDLAAAGLRALAHGRTQLPPKPKLFQRSHPGAFTNALPAYSSDGDLLGIKWVTVEARNEERGLPVINALVILNDAETGLPTCVMGGRWLTGVRTAAVTGACLRALAPAEVGHVGVLGTGLQTRTHLAVIEALGHTRVRLWGRRAASAEAVVAWAREHAPGVEIEVVATPEAACREAGAIISVVTNGATGVPPVEEAWLRPDVLLLPVDYGTCMPPALGEGRLFLADDPDQFVAIRDAGSNLAGYRRPDGPSGAYLDAPPPTGGAIVQNLGNGVSDLFVASAFVRNAERLGVGTLLPL